MTNLKISKTPGIIKVIQDDILKKLNDTDFFQLSEDEQKIVMKNYILQKATSDLEFEIKKATVDILELKETWLSTQYSEITRRNYRHNIDEYLNWLNGKSPIEIKSINADDYLIYLHKRKYKDSSIRFKIASVSSFYSFLQRHDAVRQNYFNGVKLPKRQIEVKKPGDIPTRKEIKIIEKELKQNLNATGKGSVNKINASKRSLVALYFMISTANRIGSLPYLKIFNNTNYSVKSKGTIINGKLTSDIIMLIKKFGLNEEFPFKDIKVSALKKNFERLMTRLFREGKIKKIYSPHNLKHYAAVRFWKSCKDIYKLKEFLHHKSISTSQIYLSSLNLN